eukprot:4311768-Amphidinium_carterae.1
MESGTQCTTPPLHRHQMAPCLSPLAASDWRPWLAGHSKFLHTANVEPTAMCDGIRQVIHVQVLSGSYHGAHPEELS